ncbi:MAG: hypothetical protein ACLP19_27200 [Xanthobacteraceae bacterium]
MKTRCCAYCGATLPETRLGVRLTSIKAHIFDLVQRGGADGVPREDLYAIIADGLRETAPRDAENVAHIVRNHILQINELIADEGYRIEGRSVARLVRKG